MLVDISGASLTKAQQQDAIALNKRLEANCAPSGGGYDTHSTEAQIEGLRANSKAASSTALESNGMSDAEIGCIDEQIDELPRTELFEFANDESGAGRSIAQAMLHTCEGAE